MTGDSEGLDAGTLNTVSLPNWRRWIRIALIALAIIVAIYLLLTMTVVLGGSHHVARHS
jgi:hypothetical protein